MTPPTRILQVGIDSEPDVVMVRQRARQISELLRFGVQDQVRVATAVSEVARCAYARLSGGRAQFALDLQGGTQMLIVTIRADGAALRPTPLAAGIEVESPAAQLDNAVVTAQRLMDGCRVQEGPEPGLHVVMSKELPGRKRIDAAGLNRLGAQLAASPVQNGCVALLIRRRNFPGKELGCLKLDGPVLPAHKIVRRTTSHRRHRW